MYGRIGIYLMAKPFDYVNSILRSKENLIIDDISESEYNPFLTNRALSYYPDTIMYAQEMNMCKQLDNKLQYSYLINTVRSSYRKYNKWFKSSEESDIKVIIDYYGISYQKARIALGILSKDELDYIKSKLNKGG